MKLKALSFAAVLFVFCAASVMGQGILPPSAVDATYSADSSSFQALAPTIVPPNSGSRGSWSDDFNRPDGPIGGDWTVNVGAFGIVSNQGVAQSSGNQSLKHNLANDPYEDSKCAVDFLPSTVGPNLVYVALIAGWGTDDIFVKVQDNNSDGYYDRVFFYKGLNGGSWGGSTYYFDLNPVELSGTMTLSFNNGGDQAQLDIVGASGATQTFTCDGILAAGLSLGTGFGIGAYNQPAFDNWSAGGDPNPMPTCDIKVDGQDAGAQVYVGAPCTITIDVKAGTQYAGQTVEIWWGSQKPTYLQLYYSGPLVDVKDTVWSGPLPVGVGSYMVGIGLDGKINGSKDKLYFVDTADFQVVNPPTTYEYDDGSTENLLCWTLGGDMVWMHRFDTIPGGETIAEMHCIFGSAMYPNYAPGNGTACNVYVWDDPTNNGDPSDCVLLHTEPTVVANVDLDIYNIIPLTAPLPVVSGEFYIGCCMPHGPSQFCAPIDTTTTYVWGNGYYCGTNTVGGFDPKNLMNNQYTPAEWGNYWCIRAAY